MNRTTKEHPITLFQGTITTDNPTSELKDKTTRSHSQLRLGNLDYCCEFFNNPVLVKAHTRVDQAYSLIRFGYHDYEILNNPVLVKAHTRVDQAHCLLRFGYHDHLLQITVVDQWYNMATSCRDRWWTHATYYSPLRYGHIQEYNHDGCGEPVCCGYFNAIKEYIQQWRCDNVSMHSYGLLQHYYVGIWVTQWMVNIGRLNSIYHIILRLNVNVYVNRSPHQLIAHTETLEMHGYNYMVNLQLFFLVSGLHPHPGPQDLSISIQNVSSLNGALPLVDYPIEYLFVQETSIAPSDYHHVRTKLGELGLKGFLSGNDREHEKASGGVGSLCAKKNKLIPIKPRAKQLKEANPSRYQIAGIPIATGGLLLVYNLYLWTGGQGCNEALHRSEQLLEAILADIAHYDSTPIIITGDFNANIMDMAPLTVPLNQGTLIDVGNSSIAKQRGVNTCYPSQGKPSRIDYAVVNSLAMQYVTNFQVVDSPHPVHQRLQIDFSLKIMW